MRNLVSLLQEKLEEHAIVKRPETNNVEKDIEINKLNEKFV
jgi:hypothetical protein